MTNFTTPVGRMIGGSIYKTAEKKPRPGEMPKQTTPMYDFGIAIPKDPARPHWKQTEWGAAIYAAGVAEFGANVCDHPSFAWKITDGDSATAATAGAAAPNSKEGYPGSWVLWFSGSIAPTLYNANGTQIIGERDYLKPGHYIQVLGSVRGNGNKPGNPDQKKSGVYLNHTYVAHSGFGPEISYKPDVASAGFGQSPLPAGASTTPVAALPGSPVPIAQPAFVPAPAAPMTATAVMPNPAMIPSAPPAAPAGPRFVMTPAAQGYTREQMLASGWTDETLQTNGYMTVVA